MPTATAQAQEAQATVADLLQAAEACVAAIKHLSANPTPAISEYIALEQSLATMEQAAETQLAWARFAHAEADHLASDADRENRGIPTRSPSAYSVKERAALLTRQARRARRIVEAISEACTEMQRKP